MLKRFNAIVIMSVLVIVNVFAMTGCGANEGAGSSKNATADNPMILTLAHGLSESHTVHIAMTKFAKEVKEKTNGRIVKEYSVILGYESWRIFRCQYGRKKNRTWREMGKYFQKFS